jgi:hypothetical protein
MLGVRLVAFPSRPEPGTGMDEISQVPHKGRLHVHGGKRGRYPFRHPLLCFGSVPLFYSWLAKGDTESPSRTAAAVVQFRPAIVGLEVRCVAVVDDDGVG